MSLFRPSGGLLYHWRAWCERRRWQGFRTEVESWPNDWSVDTRELILIGPSGGYTLPTNWLAKFDRIYAYDSDPLAPWFFKRRHPGVPVQFFREDLFFENGEFSALGLHRALGRHPKAAVLLSNILGQLLLEHPVGEAEWEEFLCALRLRLQRTQWASYHDLYTHEDGEIIDHLMDGKWKEGLETRQFRWPLTRSSFHLIEGVRQPIDGQ